MPERTPPPVSLSHPDIGSYVLLDSKTWKISKVFMKAGEMWAALQNICDAAERIEHPRTGLSPIAAPNLAALRRQKK